MNSKLFYLLFAATLTAIAVGSLRNGTNTSPTEEKVVASALDDLLKQRRDCLAGALKSQMAEFTNGHCSVHPPLYLNDQLLAAELEVEKKTGPRRKVYEAYLDLAGQLEKFALVNFQNGTSTRQAMLTAKAQRLQGEIYIARLDEKRSE